MFYKKLSKKSDSYFQRKTGVKKETFQEMVNVVNLHISSRPTKRGNEPTHSTEDQVLMMLFYYREYITFFSLGDIYDIHESTAYRIVCKIEDILIKSRRFSLPKKKELTELSMDDVVIVDVTETSIERPKKKQRKFYSGKKKKHTIKTQVHINKKK
jgi:hypothetical protein